MKKQGKKAKATKYLNYLQNQEDPGCLKITPLCPAESEQLTEKL